MPGRLLATAAATALLLTVSTFACTNAQTSLTAPTAAKCQLNVSNSPSAFAASGGSGTLNVTTTPDCTWTISTDVNWISIPGPHGGQGDASVSYTVAANSVPSSRSGSVAVGSVGIELSQAAAACQFSLSRSTDTIAAAGGRLTVNVSSLAGCSWAATSGSNWISITSGQSGNGNGTVSLNVSANAGGARVGPVNIAGQPYAVTQAAPAAPAPAPPNPTPVPVPAPVPAPPAPRCQYSLSRSNDTITATGGRLTVGVSSSAGCSWTATSGSNWISIISGQSGNGSGTVTLDVSANSGAARVGSVNIAGQPYAVTQAPPPAPPPPAPAPPKSVHLEGRAQSLTGDCPVLHFTVNGTAVSTDSSTDFKKGNCRSLKSGTSVSVDGVSDGNVVNAKTVEINH